MAVVDIWDVQGCAEIGGFLMDRSRPCLYTGRQEKDKCAVEPRQAASICEWFA
ncbi:hypothetical protein HPP92_016200 [Vanilla planifolia]|uniref:Uncharacterized protein n=1 Tax=Vanilla planifolia TaxID=51239 RepID=A0A835QFV0_VANPL|nr:hypothetical protein HPP92_016786 [Vanilla planifolia]KAG0471654.1 hypothetical protein HPP92_016200 [Vanilla planifolia]